MQPPSRASNVGSPQPLEDPMSTSSPTNGQTAVSESIEELGPIDILVIGYPADAPMTGEAVPMVMDLVERGIIRILDVLFVTLGPNGTYAGFEASDLDDKGVGDFRVFEG